MTPAPKKKHPWRKHFHLPTPEQRAELAENKERVLPYQHNPLRRYYPK